MSQPIPKKIKETHPELAIKPFNTLLIDGSNLLELSNSACVKINSNGCQVGGIFQSLLQIKLLLQKGNFKYVYCFFDGSSSGNLRYREYPLYKMNRPDKQFNDDDLSDYMKEFKDRVDYMKSKIKKSKPSKTDEEKENFFWQRDILIQCLDELFVRSILCDETEADDFIGYYVTHKKPEEKIVIMSNDRDLTQLIDKDVIVYIQSMKDFVNSKNSVEKLGYNYQNVVLYKMLCGDASDNIKGVKQLGNKTLLDNYPEFKTRKVELSEVIDRARKINEDRASMKKKPLKWAENIVNGVTDGCQGDRLYEINEKIINLKKPLMTQDAIDLIDSFMYSPLDPEGRSMENLYRIILDNDIDDLKDESAFGKFFVEFEYLIDNEKKNQ